MVSRYLDERNDSLLNVCLGLCSQPSQYARRGRNSAEINLEVYAHALLPHVGDSNVDDSSSITHDSNFRPKRHHDDPCAEHLCWTL